MIASTLLLAFMLSSATPAEQEAARVEAEAFVAVDASRWCDAVHLFERAYELAPAAALLDNAAQGAELANDHVAARRLLTAAIASAATPAEQRLLRARLATVDKKLKRGPGTPCPPPVVVVTEETPTAPVPTAPTTLEPPTTTPTTTTTETTSAPAPLPPGPPVAAIASTVVGGALVVGGGVACIVGALPWRDHADAVERLQRAQEAQQIDDDAVADQAAARAAWNAWGQALTVVGAAAVGVGVVVLGGGIVLLATHDSE